MTTDYKRLVTIGIVIAAAALLVSFIFTHLPKRSTAKGTSSFAAFDIVSGELSSDMRSDILNGLSSVAKTSIEPSDIQLRKGTYQKLYDNNGVDYSLVFTVDIASVKSSYDVSVSYMDTVVQRVAVGCAAQQKVGYTCVDQEGFLD